MARDTKRTTDGTSQIWSEGIAGTTARAYAERFRHLVALFEADEESGEFAGDRRRGRWRRYADWLLERRAEIARNTWYQYKAASLRGLAVVLSSHGTADDLLNAARRDLELAIATLAQARPPHAGARSPKRTVRKAKKLPEEDLERLTAYFSGGGDENDPRGRKRGFIHALTISWLIAARLTGLRPLEWKGARLATGNEGETLLVVRNFKQSQDRANGEYRVLDLSGLNARQLRHIRDFIETFDPDNAESLYESCRKELQRANQRLWPNRKARFTLYSPRHQFSANAKALYSKTEVAALMGHASEDTAGRHYGRRQAADRNVATIGMPKPDSASVAAVSKVGEFDRRTQGRLL